jgi:hypothetical protein
MEQLPGSFAKLTRIFAGHAWRGVPDAMGFSLFTAATSLIVSGLRVRYGTESGPPHVRNVLAGSVRSARHAGASAAASPTTATGHAASTNVTG